MFFQATLGLVAIISVLFNSVFWDLLGLLHDPYGVGLKPNQAGFASLTGFVIFVTTAQATLGLVPKITKPRLSAGLDWGLAERMCQYSNLMADDLAEIQSMMGESFNRI